MNTSIILASPTENLLEITDDERQLNFQEQLMLDRQSYYQDSRY
jgi:hypothetical protein